MCGAVAVAWQVGERSREELERAVRDNERLRRELERVESERDRLERERARLEKELEAARRAAKRQAAPFSKGEPTARPHRPGRKPGRAYGTRAWRPAPTSVDEGGRGAASAGVRTLWRGDCGSPGPAWKERGGRASTSGARERG